MGFDPLEPLQCQVSGRRRRLDGRRFVFAHFHILFFVIIILRIASAFDVQVLDVMRKFNFFLGSKD